MAGKGCYPWRLGAPSFVVPADIRENVRRLAPLVDDVQLLFFESASAAGLEHPLDLPFLARMAREQELTYTVHLPLDLHLGSSSPEKREAALAEILRLAELLSPIAPRALDLHLLPEEQLTRSCWLDNLDSSLAFLSREFAGNRQLIAIENCDYPFAWVRDLSLAHGFSLCLDFGHALRYNADLDLMLADIARARHLHYHGVVAGRDHQALSPAQNGLSADLAAGMAHYGFAGVITMETYSLDALKISLETLGGIWRNYQTEGR